jgi:[protein-PII] uridylyltransferase
MLRLSDSLAAARLTARRRLEAGKNGLSVARGLAVATDGIVNALHEAAREAAASEWGPMSERFAVIAVGGYGRGELAPSSDIDLLFLRGGKQGAHAARASEYMLYVLWDLGLKVGHASRTIDESLKLAREDHTIETALLEARYICGDKALADDLLRRFRKEVAQRNHAEFIAAKLRERDERHQRSGASRYMVEPNIKESKGGLRDLHTLNWMARHRYGLESIQDYVKMGVFSSAEVWAYRRALEFLWTVRCHLHFVTGRGDERLTFDVQPEMARRMGFQAKDGLSAVERFMRRYFLVVRRTGTLTRVLCARLEADHAKSAPRGLVRLLPARRRSLAAIDKGFVIDGGRLNIVAPEVLEAPESLVRVFAIAEKHDLDIHPEALAVAARRVRQLPESWREQEAPRQAFLEAITGKRPGAALRLMNEAGVLGRLIPEFGRIIAQMQFNMYHHFTVDEHTLRAIEAITEIEQGRHAEQHPLATSIFPKIVNRRALYLAMLLHDTGKGDGDQQIEGEISARAACTRLGLPAEEVDLVGWLVGHHLVMSDVAQKRDIGDPRTVAQFAEVVGTVERLRLLLILTVADIRAVGPNVWNDWKGQLLRDLYRLTEVTLQGGEANEDSVRAHLARMADEAKEGLLSALGEQDSETLGGWLDALDDSYWLSHDAEALAWHAGEVRAGRWGTLPHVATRIREKQGVTDVLVFAADRPGLFASVATAISASGADIAGARVHTTKDREAFDIFTIQTADHKPFGQRDERALKALRERIARASVEDHVPAPLSPLARRAAAFAIEPWVRVDNDITSKATVIEVSGRDRMGLLADLARVCAEAKVSIISAHVDTYGERAADAFYVTEEDGAQLVAGKRATALRAQLEAVLRVGEPEAAKAPLTVARASTAR